MNFDFSDDSKMLREQARRFLAEKCTSKAVRTVLEGEAPYLRPLWCEMAEMGWLGAAIPEDYEGGGLGHEALCVLAEELGRANAPVPFVASIALGAEAILAAGSAAQKRAHLPGIARGETIATAALGAGPGEPRAARVQATLREGRISGEAWPVPDGMVADLAVVAAREGGGVTLALVDLNGPGVKREALESLDPTAPQARLRFESAPAETMAGGWDAVGAVLDRAAVLVAFAQIGGASACLEMATAYAKERHAFGRPIGSFQAIKHRLADVYVATELARSNAYYGAWALQAGAAELGLAAATARVSASEAGFFAAKENIQVHGGIGFTWEMDCHLFYRRAKHLGLVLGSARYWKDRLVSELEVRNAA
ncbi:MAG TPA: acyl-CoA dehydrogenase family protein [Acetobacteraceae bacterium]|nr:acyl-CoA dehydrogenase family protein [Acetobacteraceae bacterium]